MMAPTEVLARQHYESITSLFEAYNIPIKSSAFDRLDDGKRKTQSLRPDRVRTCEDHRGDACTYSGRSLL